MNAARELRRVRYLQAMGLPCHVARRPLPGAAPSRYLGLRRPAQAARALPGTPSAAAAPAAPAPATAGPAPRRATEPVQRFSVAALVAGGYLWVEDLAALPLAREQLQLVAAIARALRHPQVDAAPPRVAQFDWPLHNNPQLAQDRREAAAALHSFLSRQLADADCGALLCLGAAARERLAGDDFPVPVHSLPSTRELLREPVLKGELWRQLRRELLP